MARASNADRMQRGTGGSALETRATESGTLAWASIQVYPRDTGWIV